MSTTLTFASGVTITPLVVEGWSQSRGGGAKEHALIDGGVDYTHTPRLWRTGRLSLIFDNESDAIALDTAVIAEPYFDIASDAATLANGRFVPVGDVTITQLDARTGWRATFDVSEDA